MEGVLLGNYRVGRELGRGGMGTVYRAVTEAGGPAGPAGSSVAVKVFHPHLAEDPRTFERFGREAELGMRIRHPGVVRTHEVGRSDVDGKPVHWIAMELVEGRTLADLERELGAVPEQLLSQIADQVLDALEAVHALGIVHRDVKPENLVVTPDHRVLLMDLGIARLEQHGQTLTQAGEFVGSVAYAAPEQFRGGEVDVGPAADLYAFGLVLYELATARNPFDASNIRAVLDRKMRGEVDPPRSVRPEVSPFWDALIATAVRRDPAERFSSAAQMRRVLFEGEEGEWWRVRLARTGADASVRAVERLRLDREVRRVGRDAEMEALLRAWGTARASGGVLLLGGAAGLGKSRLVFDFLERVLDRAGGACVAAGRCVGAGGRGYAPFVEALEGLLCTAEAEPARRRAALEATLAPLLADTPGLVPRFADFVLGALQPGADGGFSKDALFGACTRLLGRLAARRPLVLVVEDLHEAGPESVELFGHLARGVAGHPMLLLGVSTDDEVAEGGPLQTLLARSDVAIARLAVPPLSEEASEDLVRAVVRGERTVRALHRPLRERCDGNPFLLLEMLADLRSDGTLARDGEGWALARPLDALAVPSTIRGLLGLKLARLDDAQRSTLEAAAVLGYEFDAAVLAEVLGENRLLVLQRLAVLERRHRCLASHGRSGYRFAGRPLYETVYDAMSPALRSEVHSLAADALLARARAAPGGRPDGATSWALLRHLSRAERALEAEPWLEAALDHAAASFHASYAAPVLERIAAAFADAPPPPRFAIAARLSATYEMLGRREDQMRVLDVAQALADRIGEPGARSRVLAQRAGSHWYAGEWTRASEEARQALALAREAGDRKGEATCRHTLGAVAYRLGDLAGGVAEWEAALAIRREIGDRRGVASTLQALGLVLADVGRESEAVAALEEALSTWREIGERRGEAATLMNLGNRHLEEARYEEGRRCYELAIAGHRETGALVSEATALANLGRAHETVGRIDAARTAWERALALFTDLSDPNGELAVRTMLGGALSAYGAREEAQRHLEAAVALAERRGAKPKLAAACRELGKLLHAEGRRPEGWAHLERALALESEAKSVHGRVLALSEMANAAIEEGDSERAVRWLAEASEAGRDARGTTPVLVLCRLARAHRAAGRAERAAAIGLEALARLEAAGTVSPAQGPEIYGTLADVLEGGARRAEFLARARTMTEERARNIRDDDSRARFLARNRFDPA